MEDQLVDLSGTLLKIYVKNLEFLEEYFNDIYLRVEELSKKLNNNEYSPKYSLEYRDGYFDILNTHTNSWFYNTNSYEDADFRANGSNFTKDGSLDLLRKDATNSRFIGSESFGDVLPILDFMNKKVNMDNIEFQRIYKFIFLGVGVGVHLHEINKKLNPFTTLIIEPELEVFRLSLFIIDYKDFHNENKKLFLSIEDDKQQRIGKIEEFYQYHNYMNYNIKHHLLVENYSYLKDEVIDFFATNSVATFPYKLTIDNIHKTIGFIKDKSRFLSANDIVDKKILKGKDVLLIAAGPSLDNYISWIEEHQDKFIIVCVDVILRKLEKYNIAPDIVVSIDPSYLCAKYLTCEDKNFLKNSSIVFLSQQHKSVMDVVKDYKYYFAQSVFLIPELGYLGSVSNVGTYSLLVASHLGASRIYTIGNDAAFDSKTGSRYTKDSTHSQYENTELEDKKDKDFVSAYDIVEVEGNLRDKVKTNRSLLIFKDSFESIIPELKNYNEFELFNLSDGVKLDGFTPMSFDEIDNIVRDLDKKENNIQILLDSVSTVVEMPDYKGDIQILNSILNRVKKHKNIKIKGRDNYLEQKLDIMMWILEKSKKMSSSVFGNIFLLYIELADIYVNFLLNLKQKDLHTVESLSTINRYWTDGVIGVIKDMKKAIDIDN